MFNIVDNHLCSSTTQKELLSFHGNNSYAKEPHWVRTLSIYY